MINKLLFYVSDNFDPYRNLAIEKQLFDSVGDDCLILYLWQNQNTVVIGKNQNAFAECNCSLLEKEGGKLARRLSGGGAVFHDIGNLNFTFICKEENYDLARHMQVIGKACALAGIETEISGRNDILASGRKFSGNAFYSAKGKSYHHGTILINADKEKMTRYLTPSKIKLESKGIKSVKSRVINLCELSQSLTVEDMKKHMLAAFEEAYGLTASPFAINDTSEIIATAELYAKKEYIYNTSIPFTVSFEDRLSFGSVQLQLCVKDGIIKDAQLYTDSMDWQISEAVKEALSRCRYDNSEIEASLKGKLPENIAQEIASMIEKQCI